MTLRPNKRVLGVAVLVLLASGIVTWSAWSPAAPHYPAEELGAIALPHRFRSGPEHDTALARIGNPYVLEHETHERGALLYYGAKHTGDSDDPQIADIERRWIAFRPTVALCEGRSRGYFARWPMTTWGGLTEPAWVHCLARRDDVPLHSLEPAYEDEVTALLREFPAAHVALYFTMRVYWSESQGKANESLALDLLEKRTDVEGLRGALSSISDVDSLWQRRFRAHGDWRTRKTEPQGSRLAEISQRSRIIRGEHMARLLLHLVGRGERVFAVVGSGHVIRQEWALRASLDAEPAFDQPK